MGISGFNYGLHFKRKETTLVNLSKSRPSFSTPTHVPVETTRAPDVIKKKEYSHALVTLYDADNIMNSFFIVRVMEKIFGRMWWEYMCNVVHISKPSDPSEVSCVL